MIYIGNQTSFAASVTTPFDFALANGFDAFEWFPDRQGDSGWDDRDLDARRRLEIRDKARAAGMRFSVHARWQANPFQAESYPLFWKDLELAQDLGAVLLNIHLAHEQGVDSFLNAILPLAERVAAAGLSLSMENTPFHPPELFNDFFAAVRRKSFPSLRKVGMCLDLGHANLCEATRNRYLEFIDRLSPEVPLIHVHLHENWGDADSHLPVFTGPSARNDAGIRGLLERLHHRGFSGSIILEQWPSPPSLLSEARTRLLKMLNGSGTTSTSKPIPRNVALSVKSAGDNAKRVRISPSAKKRPTAERSASSAQPSADKFPLSASDGEKGPPDVPQSSFASALTAGDKNSRSWREKLEAVQKLLDQFGSARPARNEREDTHTDRLTYLAIYLRFLGTGQIACEEDGRHFRPAHHAQIAENIRERVAAMTTPENAFIARKIYPWLPSSAQAFRRAEPLTRIRDIAHRNDIPSELKREIKHSLQNKLHRCAGPEDLVTATTLLERITAPGATYPPAFVEQFKLFHEELKEFFNARSLEDLLKAQLGKSPPEEGDLIQSFLASKDKTDVADQIASLSTLTELRSRFHPDLEKSAETGVQEFLMADLALEDFAFVLLSQILNHFDVSSASPVNASTIVPDLLKTLGFTIKDVALSEIEPEECGAISSEVSHWSSRLDLNFRDELLRLAATVERSRRLSEDYTQRILTLFPARVQQLGHALGVDEKAVRVFCESDVRGHIIFQLSKMASSLLRELRQLLQLPPWDVLVSGKGAGIVTLAQNFEDLNPTDSEQRLVVLQRAEGDEEIPRGIAGVVLAHELPHLSHLAVRARQAGVVFVTCREASAFDAFKKLEGQRLAFSATDEGFKWSTLPSQGAENWNTKAASPVRGALRTEAPGLKWSQGAQSESVRSLPLEKVTLAVGGAKADNARRLAELAFSAKSGFKVPPGVVVPFGVMETKLHAVPELERKYQEWIAKLEPTSLDEVGPIADELRQLIRQLPVPDEITSELGRFGPEARFMVRSSSNLEDLAESAGAGLYESIANVRLADVPTAVREVWSSLWTRRAALSRQQAGIGQSEARMAVLIQTMLAPEFSFVIHTVNPLNQNRQEVYAEVVVGLGETLVSGAAHGTPFRLVSEKATGKVQTLAFANLSRALRPAERDVVAQTVDYSRILLSVDSEARASLGRRLASVGKIIEDKFGGPQDIEGAILDNEVWIVQTRPQQGLTSK